MRRRRAAAAAIAAIAVVGLSGCILPPPSRAPEPPAPPTSEPTASPSTRPVVPRAHPTPDADPPAESTERVQPDAPAVAEDQTANDTGELYAGEEPITDDGYSPDGQHDLVLAPTRGTPVVAPGIAMPEHEEGDELLEGTEHTADASLLLTTVGRLELEAGSSAYTCTGTVINSETGLIVLTAAHCIFNDDTRDDYDRITFSPGYERGESPFGVWEAESWWVPEQYMEANDRWLDGQNDNGWMGFDFGFIRFRPLDARTLEDVVGGQGVSFTAETNGVVVAGYPGNSPFDSEVLRYCAAAEPNYGAGGDPNYGVSCDMGDGASGSGWVSNLDPATGAGQIVAVYSNGGASGAYGPPLGITAWNGLQTLDR